MSWFINLFKKTKVEGRIVLIGLDGAGKTTILKRLIEGKFVQTEPTVGIKTEEVKIGNVEFKIWDLGGQRSVRDFWESYLKSSDVIILVVDAADQQRLDELKEEFWKLENKGYFEKKLLFVIANKQDIDGCMTGYDIVRALELDKLKYFNCQVCETSALTSENIRETFENIAENFFELKKTNK